MLQEVDITEAGENNPEDFKIVVIGDGAVGKTCLCTVFALKKFPEEYETTIFDKHPTKLTLFDKVNLSKNILQSTLNIFL